MAGECPGGGTSRHQEGADVASSRTYKAKVWGGNQMGDPGKDHGFVLS